MIASQRHEGWECLSTKYDDGGFTGGNLQRPAMQRLMADVEAGRIDCVVVYKVDRLSRSLLDFSKLMEKFEAHGVSFVSVTQQFNTATSMGRLILNVLLSFAQFEREMISERTRDKIAATRRKGKWAGGMPLLGYDVVDTKLVVVPEEAERVRQIFKLYLHHLSLLETVKEINERGWRTKLWTTKKGTTRGGRLFDKNNLRALLTNPTYTGKVKYRDELFNGEHEAIIEESVFKTTARRLRQKPILDRMPNAQGLRLLLRHARSQRRRPRRAFTRTTNRPVRHGDMGSLTTLYTDKAIAYLKERRDPDKPFVLYRGAHDDAHHHRRLGTLSRQVGGRSLRRRRRGVRLRDRPPAGHARRTRT